MAYSKGNFYHEKGEQVVDAEFKVGNAKMIGSAEVPTAATVAPAGSLCLCTAEGSIGLYINAGSEDAPDWKKVTTE